MTTRLAPGIDELPRACMLLGLLIETVGDIGESDAQLTAEEVRGAWALGDAAAAGCGLSESQRPSLANFTPTLQAYMEWWQQPGIGPEDAVASLVRALTVVGSGWRGDAGARQLFATRLVALLGADGRMTKAERSLLPWVLHSLRIQPEELRTAMLPGGSAVKAAGHPFLPSVGALRALREKSAQKTILCEHWWMPEHRTEGRIKPSYGWAVARLAVFGTGDADMKHLVDWRIVESMTLAQLRHEGKAHKDVMGLLSTSDRCVAVANFGQQWLSVHFFATDPGQVDGVSQLERCIGLALAKNPSIELSIEPSGPRIDFLFTMSLPLEFLEPDVRVRRITEGSKTKALVLGFVPGPQALQGRELPGVGKPPFAFCIGATDDEPEALEQLEHFLASYTFVYGKYVKPMIGRDFMINPRVEHSFMTNGEWSSLAVDAMPKSRDHIPNGQLRSGIRQAVVASGAKIDESTWHDCLLGSPDDPTKVT
jgi:hypothetical protein